MQTAYDLVHGGDRASFHLPYPITTTPPPISRQKKKKKNPQNLTKGIRLWVPAKFFKKIAT